MFASSLQSPLLKKDLGFGGPQSGCKKGLGFRVRLRPRDVLMWIFRSRIPESPSEAYYHCCLIHAWGKCYNLGCSPLYYQSLIGIIALL